MKTNRTLLLLGGLLMAVIAFAATYSGYLINDPVLAVDTNATINLNTVVRGGVHTLSAQAIYSSATVPSQNFTDGRVSTGSITVASLTGLTTSFASNTITVAATNAILAQPATNQITVVSTTGISGAVITFNNNALTEGVDWLRSSYSTQTAQNIATALGRSARLRVSRAGSVVYATATVSGVGGNAFTMVSSTPTAISLSGSTFSGGRNAKLTNAYITINGVVLSQRRSWAVTDTSSGTATNIARVLNHVTGIRAAAAGSVVYTTATVAGTAGNAFTLASSVPAYLTVANPTYTGGVDNAYVRINGVTLTRGVAWQIGSTSSATAKSISDAIVANSSLNTIIASTWTAGGVVYATSTAAGIVRNYALVGYPSNKLTTSGAAFTGGTDASYAANTAVLTIPSHGFGTGLSVLYSTGTLAIGGLTNQTTYYVVKVNANQIALSSSKANAVAGSTITLTSLSVVGPHTFTLAPTAPTGSAGIVWQGSNNCSTYSNLAVSSVTFSTPYTAATTTWDFGTVNYACMRAVFTATTTGATNLAISVNGH